jgi:hypothetical protein
MAAVGAGLILAGARRPRDWTDPVQRLTATLVSNDLTTPIGVDMPRHIAVTAVGATATLTLVSGMPVDANPVEIAVSCFAGRVKLNLPDGWIVTAGRVHHTWAIRFEGRIDQPAPVIVSESHPAGPPTLIVHVLGVAGLVELDGRSVDG